MTQTWRDKARRAQCDDDGERGATLVEYALLVALFGLVVVGGLGVLQDRAEDRYDRSAEGITEVAGVVIEAPPAEDPDETPTPSPTVSSSCTGASCGLSLTSPPSEGTITWTTSPDVGSGTGPTFSVTGQKNGGPYLVTATIEPGGTAITRTVTCTKGNTTVCTAD